MQEHGLVIVHTGDGKGKTTAALGLAIRAWGSGLRVLIVQFIKSGANYGEIRALQALEEIDGHIHIESCGLGFTRKGITPQVKHRIAAQQTIQLAKKAIKSELWDMIILDEINYAVKFGLLTQDDVAELLDIRPKNLHLVFTGRDACPLLLDRADLVTEMHLIKHPFQQGIEAQRGIEF